MRIIRFIFAPFFWLRDIRNSLVQIESLLRWQYCLNVRYCSLSGKGKKMLLAAMLRKRGRSKRIAAAEDISPTAILEALELDD